MLLIVEVFVYCTYSEREEVIVEFRPPLLKKRLGTVITTGKLAATISEHETQRQFIAKFTIWGDLEPGNLVSFCIDPSFSTSGKHIVGGRHYLRYFCVPTEQGKEEMSEYSGHMHTEQYIYVST